MILSLGAAARLETSDAQCGLMVRNRGVRQGDGLLRTGRIQQISNVNYELRSSSTAQQTRVQSYNGDVRNINNFII